MVLDARTGDLLASVTYPWPQRLPVEPSDDPTSGVIDRARYGIYPPGSTFKLVTAMAALRKDPAVAGESSSACRCPAGGWATGCAAGAGRSATIPPSPARTARWTWRRGSASCNAYFAQLGTYEVGPEPLLETAHLLGITVASPNTPEQLKEALPQASYGQGQVIATPFQMARVAATVANGGPMPEGRWTTDETERRAASRWRSCRRSRRRSCPRHARGGDRGHRRALLAGVQPPIAGKTGTAEVQGKNSHSWFIGFAPYGAPARGAAARRRGDRRARRLRRPAGRAGRGRDRALGRGARPL